MEVKMSLDNISITAKINEGGETKINEFLSSGYVESNYWHSPKNFMYQHNFAFPDGSFFQYGVMQGEEAARVEFNPNKCDWRLIHRIMKRLKYPKVTRLDIACDYFGVDLSRCKIVPLTSRSTETIKGRSGKLETLYIGSRRSDKFVRVYDKAKELKKNAKKEEEEEIEVDEDYWRVETVVKDFTKIVEKEFDSVNEKGEKEIIKKKVKVDGSLFENPFKIFLMEKEEEMNQQLKIAEKAMLYYLENHPEEWENLSRNSRKKYEDMSFACRYKLMENQPYDVFEKEKDRLQEELYYWLEPALKNNINFKNDYIEDTMKPTKKEYINRPIGDLAEKIKANNYSYDEMIKIVKENLLKRH